MFIDGINQVARQLLGGTRVLFIDTSDDVSFIYGLRELIETNKVIANGMFNKWFIIDSNTGFDSSLQNILNPKEELSLQALGISNISGLINSTNEAFTGTNCCVFFIRDSSIYLTTGKPVRALKNYVLQNNKGLFGIKDDVNNVFIFIDHNITVPQSLEDICNKTYIGYPDKEDIEYELKYFIINYLLSSKLGKQLFPDVKYKYNTLDKIDDIWDRIKEMSRDGTEVLKSIDSRNVTLFNFESLLDDVFFNTVVDQLKGLSFAQVRKAIGLSIIDKGYESGYEKLYVKNALYDGINLSSISNFKINVNKYLIEHIETNVSFNDIGGLKSIKDETDIINIKLDNRSKAYNLEPYKGMLLVGIPGTGKTTVAKAIANKLNIPLLRLDVGRLFGNLVGDSEKNTRLVLQKLEVMAPNVVLVDEIEKAFAGVKSSSETDGGTTARVFMTFLYWLQEKKENSIIVATANNIENLPPELTRAGRFDTLFYLDLPDFDERKQLISIFVKQKPKIEFKINIDNLANQLENYTGAELFTLIDRCCTIIFSNIINERYPKYVDDNLILSEVKNINKIAEVKKNDIIKLKDWAKATNARPASGKSWDNEFKIGMN